MGEAITFLDLGRQPLANGFLDKKNDSEYFYNLTVSFDPTTYLVSLNKFVDPAMMFNGSYKYVSSGSQTMRTHFKNIANELEKQFSPSSVLEIGSNDGVFIKNFDSRKTFAVEPCTNFAEITNNIGYKTYAQFWNKNTAFEIINNHGRMDLIYSANCISHIENINETLQSIANTLSPKGVFVLEDPSILDVIKSGSYDQIYDEHAYVFSVLALNKVLSLMGLRIFRVERLDIHGGSRRLYIDKVIRPVENSVTLEMETERFFGIDDPSIYFFFAKKVEKSKEDLRRLLITLKDNKKKIISYGATGKSTTIFNYCDIGPEIIDYITDITPDKQGKFSPGMHIPIVAPEGNFPADVDMTFLGAWNFYKEIMDKEKTYNGKWLTHVPKVRII